MDLDPNTDFGGEEGANNNSSEGSVPEEKNTSSRPSNPPKQINPLHFFIVNKILGSWAKQLKDGHEFGGNKQGLFSRETVLTRDAERLQGEKTRQESQRDWRVSKFVQQKCDVQDFNLQTKPNFYVRRQVIDGGKRDSLLEFKTRIMQKVNIMAVIFSAIKTFKVVAVNKTEFRNFVNTINETYIESDGFQTDAENNKWHKIVPPFFLNNEKIQQLELDFVPEDEDETFDYFIQKMVLANGDLTPGPYDKAFRVGSGNDGLPCRDKSYNNFFDWVTIRNILLAHFDALNDENDQTNDERWKILNNLRSSKVIDAEFKRVINFLVPIEKVPVAPDSSKKIKIAIKKKINDAIVKFSRKKIQAEKRALRKDKVELVAPIATEQTKRNTRSVVKRQKIMVQPQTLLLTVQQIAQQIRIPAVQQYLNNLEGRQKIKANNALGRFDKVKAWYSSKDEKIYVNPIYLYTYHVNTVLQNLFATLLAPGKYTNDKEKSRHQIYNLLLNEILKELNRRLSQLVVSGSPLTYENLFLQDILNVAKNLKQDLLNDFDENQTEKTSFEFRMKIKKDSQEEVSYKIVLSEAVEKKDIDEMYDKAIATFSTWLNFKTNVVSDVQELFQADTEFNSIVEKGLDDYVIYYDQKYSPHSGKNREPLMLPNIMPPYVPENNNAFIDLQVPDSKYYSTGATLSYNHVEKIIKKIEEDPNADAILNNAWRPNSATTVGKQLDRVLRHLKHKATGLETINKKIPDGNYFENRATPTMTEQEPDKTSCSDSEENNSSPTVPSETKTPESNLNKETTPSEQPELNLNKKTASEKKKFDVDDFTYEVNSNDEEDEDENLDPDEKNLDSVKKADDEDLKFDLEEQEEFEKEMNIDYDPVLFSLFIEAKREKNNQSKDVLMAKFVVDYAEKVDKLISDKEYIYNTRSVVNDVLSIFQLILYQDESLKYLEVDREYPDLSQYSEWVSIPKYIEYFPKTTEALLIQNKKDESETERISLQYYK